MTTVEEILKAARALRSNERAQLLHALLDSVSLEDWPAPGEDWLDEVQRRSDACDNNQMPLTPWAEVRQRTRQQAGLDG